jgi:hypothetical protein
LLIFLGIVFLTGGGSRSDISSLAILRFVAACSLAWGIWRVSRLDLARIWIPLILLAAVAGIAIVQLIPLPPGFWAGLPGRELIARIDGLIGLDVWRPISLSPARTANTLASLVVPLAALVLFATVRDRNTILLGLVFFGVLSGLVGVLQLSSDPRSAIYFYKITNSGSAVGLFANRNHHAVFLACCVLISLYLMRPLSQRLPNWKRWSLAGSVVFMTLAIVANGSRAGLIALFLVILIAAIAAVLERSRFTRRDSSASAVRRYLFPAGLAVTGAVIFTLFAFAGRSTAISRLLAGGQIEDLREKLLPYLLNMITDFQPFGTGLGAFEYAYKMREPYELLNPSYLNQAHNDWLQFPIEGGVAAITVMVVGLGFAAIRLFRLAKLSRGDAPRVDECWLGFGLLLILAIASVVDYPLRVPSIMSVAIIALAMFAQPLRAKEI